MQTFPIFDKSTAKRPFTISAISVLLVSFGTVLVLLGLLGFIAQGSIQTEKDLFHHQISLALSLKEAGVLFLILGLFDVGTGVGLWRLRPSGRICGWIIVALLLFWGVFELISPVTWDDVKFALVPIALSLLGALILRRSAAAFTHRQQPTD